MLVARRAVSAKPAELQTAKEILVEVFGARPADVAERSRDKEEREEGL